MVTVILLGFFSGLPPEKKAFFKNAKTEISYAQDGEFWTITVGMQGVPDNRTFRFKLGDPYDSASLDGSKMKVSLCVFNIRDPNKNCTTSAPVASYLEQLYCCYYRYNGTD